MTKVAKISEEKLIEIFKEILLTKNGIQESQIEIAPKNNSKIMDFNIKNPLTSTCVCLEAKVFNDTRTNSNSFLSLFGKIIKGRQLIADKRICDFDNYEYGFLFHKQDQALLKRYFSTISEKDWHTFCADFNVKHIYIVKSESQVLHLTPQAFKDRYMH